MARKGNLTLGNLSLGGKVGLGFGLALLVGAAYFIVFYNEVSSAITAQQRQEQNLRQELGNARQSETAYNQDLMELKKKEQLQRELNKILPETTESPAFLSAIQGVANVSGVTLQSWTPLPEARQQFFAKVPMKVTLEGRFHQIMKFFWGVGQLDRIINVENIALSNPKISGDEVRLKVDCLTTAFRTLPTQPANAPPKKGK